MNNSKSLCCIQICVLCAFEFNIFYAYVVTYYASKFVLKQNIKKIDINLKRKAYSNTVKRRKSGEN